MNRSGDICMPDEQNLYFLVNKTYELQNTTKKRNENCHIKK